MLGEMKMKNRTIAQLLSNHAKRLEKEQANLYRVNAYRRAAQTIMNLAVPVNDLVAREGIQALEQLPGIGGRLAFAIERLAATGHFHALTESAASVPPEDQIESLPGVGPHLAQRLWEQ